MFWLIVVLGAIYLIYRYLYMRPHVAAAQQTFASSSQRSTPTVPPVPVPPTKTFSVRHEVAATAGMQMGKSVELNWCNELTAICWPHIGKIVELNLSPTLEPLINHYLPKPFTRFRFLRAKLGKDPVTVDNIVVHKRHENSIALDVDVTFLGHPDMAMKCAPLSTPFGIKQLTWSGRLSVLLRPLLTQLPLVGAIQASMIKAPELKMDFTGVANVAEFGPIERIVQMVLRKVLSSMLVLPNRFNYILSETVDYFDVYQPPIGIINIKIERGRHFTKEKKVGLITAVPDLYCKATFALEEMKTDVQMNNLNPEWGKSKSFILSDLDQPFELSCYDKDMFTRDDLGGTINLSAGELLERKSYWYKLQDKIDPNFAKNGEIYLSAQLYTFKDPREEVRGQCVFSILIDRAKNLPKGTKSAAVKVTLGTRTKLIEKETYEVYKTDDPNSDPSNPVWNFSFDILCHDYRTSDITLEVFSRKQILGSTHINATILEASDSNEESGEFDIGGGATLRAKVILRGLVPSVLPRCPN